ncbi:ABC transporter permease [Flavobacterium sp.]|jgi:ABC-type transport system involved in multi-copper enzyme maturation permease subunit|uniref:ABC transporter permease n=1 Tax=Flavobacterium sp. TaxID=239 RepID=UPI0022BE16E2|nr:ABC transporter permease [Flavobacterium sp.]MCZ8169533.1 ABC transporter permease [Flavobacterium sp.]
MKRLLAIELQKIWLNRASRILTLTYFGILSLIALIASIEFDLGPFHFDASEQGIFNFPYIWHLNSYIGALPKIFLALVIVSMMANEYTYGTLKQNLIDGMSKKEFVLSKFLTVLVFSGLSTVFIFVISLLLGLMYSTYDEVGIIFSEMDYLLAFFVKLTGFFSFCLFLGVLIKRSAFAIGFLFVWYLIENIGFLIFGKLIVNDFELARSIFRYMPLEAMSGVLIEPFTKLDMIQAVGNQVGVLEIKDYAVDYGLVTVVLVWTGLFIWGSYALIQKRDL